MKKTKIIKIIRIAAALAVIVTFTSCSTKQDADRTVIKEPVKNITVIENEKTETTPAFITVEKIDKYEGAEITDWLDDKTVVLSKENREYGKMELLENSEFYPRSIYLYNLDTKEYKTVKAQKNIFLGGGTLSPDKKHLLYYEYSIGDTAHYLMSMENDEQSPVAKNILGSAYTAEWDDEQNVIGASYAGGAYLADTGRKLTQIDELQGEQLFTVKKVGEKIYYITTDNPSFQLYRLNLATKEKKNLKVENVDGITPSPDGKQILITQGTESTRRLLVADAEGNNLRTIAEGTEIIGEAWSPDQSMIAYRLKSVINGSASSGLYVYNVLTGKSIQIAVNIGGAGITWSPSGKQIAVTELDGRVYNSSIIYFK